MILPVDGPLKKPKKQSVKILHLLTQLIRVYDIDTDWKKAWSDVNKLLFAALCTAGLLIFFLKILNYFQKKSDLKTRHCLQQRLFLKINQRWWIRACIAQYKNQLPFYTYNRRVLYWQNLKQFSLAVNGVFLYLSIPGCHIGEKNASFSSLLILSGCVQKR